MDAVIAHVVMAVRFPVVAPGFLYTDENWMSFFVSVESSSFLLNKLRAFRERKLNRILLGLSADVIMGTIKTYKFVVTPGVPADSSGFPDSLSVSLAVERVSLPYRVCMPVIYNTVKPR